jgi:hypothetical protein
LGQIAGGEAMKERPILFSAPMIRAILEGHKSMTRLVVKPQPPHEAIAPILENGWWMWQRFNAERRHYDGKTVDKTCDQKCPYGIPGDRLWVKESWRTIVALYGVDYEPAYRATCAQPQLYKWKSSRYMPRIASRILLEITNVRVERLQDISEEDAKAEGAPSADLFSGREVIFPQDGTHKWGFRLLWENINGPGSWEANPWVWAVEFKRVKP